MIMAMEKIYNQNPLVSVVMCCYNAEKYVGLAIESILTQSYHNIEFIIWNDGSNDNTENIIKSYNDARIRYFFHTNKGVGEAANLACSEAKGKYIARIDSDDIAEPDRISKEVEYMEHHPKCVLLSAAVTYIDEEGNVLARSYPYTWNMVLKRSMKRMSNPFSHSACIFRRDVFLNVRYPHTRCFVDAVMFRRLSRLGDVSNLKEPLIKYRLQANSVSHSLGDYMPLIKVAEKMIDETDDVEDVEEKEQLFNIIYSYAKQHANNQVNGFYNNGYSFITRILPCQPSKIVTSLVIFIHNLVGIVRYL